ncbi:MAG: archaemetzincin [Akkermansiaceae bacterium]
MKFTKSNTLILMLSLSVVAMGGLIYKQQTARDRKIAIGDLAELSAGDKVAFTDMGDGDFEAKTAPEGADWLAQHAEPGQSFMGYINSFPNLPNDRRDVIYILPVGEFPEESAPDLQMLLEYTKAYYHPMKVVMKPAVADGGVKAESRMNRGKKQWLAGGILQWMKPQLDEDAYAMISVTMTDLYPDPEWNFVFGMASLQQRVGVFSFARYRDQDESTVLRRAAKVLTHETGHMFGIKHCVYYQCNMNGANHLREMDSTPMHLCPVCLRKMQYAVKFDTIERYQKLHDFYVKYELGKEARWVKRRMGKINAAK